METYSLSRLPVWIIMIGNNFGSISCIGDSGTTGAMVKTHNRVSNYLNLLRSFFNYSCYLAISCCFLASGSDAQILQNSTDDAKVPTTAALLLRNPVVDGAITLSLFRSQGEGVDWSSDGKRIVYDCKHKDGYYNVHVCKPDGSDDRCLSNLQNGLPHRHAGSPSWHPSGKYIVLAARNPVMKVEVLRLFLDLVVVPIFG